MSNGIVGFRLNQQLTAALAVLPGSSHAVVKALFLLQLCRDSGRLGVPPELLVPDIRAVLRYLLHPLLRNELEAWLQASGPSPGADPLPLPRPADQPVRAQHAVRDDGATVHGMTPGNAVGDAGPMKNPMLDEGEEY